LHEGSAIECKVCDKDDISCLFGQDAPSYQCENDDDFCYSWFSRSGKTIVIFISILFSHFS
jgi:hypothetical protein